MKKPKKILIVAALLVLGAVAYLTLVPIDVSNWSPEIKRTIEHKINGTVDMDRISLIVLPYPRINIENFTLKDTKETVIRSETLKMGISLVPLLKRHLIFRSLIIDRGEILLRRYKDGHYNIQDILKIRLLSVSLKSLQIKRGHVNFVNEGAEGPSRLELGGIHANIYPHPWGFTYRGNCSVDPDGRLTFKGKGRRGEDDVWDLSGSLALKDIELGKLDPILKEFIERDFIREGAASGLVTLDSDYTFRGRDLLKGEGNIKGSIKVNKTTMDFPGLFDKSIHLDRGSAELALSWGPDELTMALNDTNLSVSTSAAVKGFDLKGSVRLFGRAKGPSGEGPRGKGPFVDLKLSTTPIDARTLIDLLPRKTGAGNGTISAVLANLESPGGKVTIKNLAFTGGIFGIEKGEGLNTLSMKIGLDALSLKHPAFEKSITFDRGSSGVKLTWGREKYTLEFRDTTLFATSPGSGEEFEVKGSLKLSEQVAASRGAQLDLSLSTTPFEARTLLETLPLKNPGGALTRLLAGVEAPGGKLLIKSLEFSGKVGGKGKPDYKNALKFETELVALDFSHHGLDHASSSVSGHMLFSNGRLSFEGINSRYGPSEVSNLRIDISDITEQPSYNFSFDAEADIGTVFEELSSRGLISLPDEFVVKGETKFSFRMEGIWKNSESIKYTGNVILKGVDLSYDKLPVPLNTITGEADFDRDNIVFSRLRGTSGGSAFSLDGQIKDYRLPWILFEFDTELEFDPDTMRLVFEGNERGLPAFTSTLPVSGRINGSSDSVKIQFSADTTAMDLSYGKIIKKDKGFQMNLNGIIRVVEKQVFVDEAELSFGSSSVGFRGVVERDRPGYELRYTSRDIQVKDLTGISPFFTERSASKGTLSFDITGKKNADRNAPLYEGTMAIKDWHFSAPFLKKPAKVTEVVSRFSGNSAGIIINEFRTGDSNFSGKVDLVDIAAGRVEFDLLSDFMNVDDLLPPTDMEETETRPHLITGGGKITVSQGTAWGLTFRNFSTDVLIDDKQLSFPVDLSIHEGVVTGKVLYKRDATDPTTFKTDLKVTDVSIESLITEVKTDKPVLSGRLDAEIELEGKRVKGPGTSGLQGKVSLSAEGGMMWEFVVLRKVFSIVNIATIKQMFDREEALPYKTIKGSFDIENGVIKTRDFMLDSDSLRMSAVGNINSTYKSIDATLGLHPFVTIDKIISKIPIAGWIIGGEEKSALTMYYSVKGPMKDPEVLPILAKSVEKNIRDMLERFFKRPVRPKSPLGSEPVEEKKPFGI